MAIARALAAVAGISPIGCSALDPYATFPAAALPGEPAAGARVAICYDTLVSSLDQVQAAA